MSAIRKFILIPTVSFPSDNYLVIDNIRISKDKIKVAVGREMF